MESMNMFGLLIALFSGGTGDLLDYASTDAYWKAKGTAVTLVQLVGELKDDAAPDVAALIKALGGDGFADRERAGKTLLKLGAAALPALDKAAGDPDPEVADRAGQLARQLRSLPKATAVRRLMAIRTLGEMKQPEALPALRGLLDSKVQFVADYAARAIATIEGKPAPAPPSRRAALATDVSLLPAACGVIAQARFAPAAPGEVARLLKDAPVIPGEDRPGSLAWLNTGVIDVADRVGNVRIDGVSFGVAESIGPDKGFVVIVVRGQYDAAAMAAQARAMAGEDLQATRVEGVEVLTAGDLGVGNAIALPSDDRAILFAGGTKENLPLAEVLAALKKPNAGPHPLLARPEFAALKAEVERSGDAARIWAACRVTDAYREAKPLRPFDAVTMLAVREKDATTFRLAGAGSDAAKVAAAVVETNKELEQARGAMAEVVQQMPAFKPIVNLVASLKCEATGKDATMTGRFEGEASALFAGPMMGLLTARQGMAHEAPAAKAKPDKK